MFISMSHMLGLPVPHIIYPVDNIANYVAVQFITSLIAKKQQIWLVVLKEDAMSQLFYLSAEQLERIKPFFPRSHGIPRVDDRKVISGIIYVIKHGLQWKDAPREYGPYKTLYNRFLRWSQIGIFNMFTISYYTDCSSANDRYHSHLT